DVSLRDAIGRWWQGPTIQVDFNEPERFDVTYTDADGESKRVVMVHRTVLGSMERFVAGLVEHHAGAFPTWLAPVQAIVLPVADRHARHAVEVRDRLRAADIRAEADDRSETLNRKIRDAQNQKIPYMLVVGDREVESDQVAVRTREEGDRGPTDLSDFIAEVRAEVAQATQPPDHAPS
ncbi:MAG: His/Gly/Thr/Pro-type tRNA ligase C-terminal domain-containing protein, partial [Armatimonadota bacterium]